MRSSAPHPGATSDVSITTLTDALLDINRASRLSNVLHAMALAGAALSAPCHWLCLMRDAVTDGCHLAAFLDPSGGPLDIDRLGIPSGPWQTAPVVSDTPRPLAALLHEAWSRAACEDIERRLGTGAALCVPIQSEAQARGALLALLPARASADIVLAILRHGAATVARGLREYDPTPLEGVLNTRALDERAGKEIARAGRYRREVAVVVFQPAGSDLLATFAPRLVHGLRRWDLVGRMATPSLELVAVLPETGRGGARGLVRRLYGALEGIRTGAAVFPEDGASLHRLADVARGRTAVPADDRAERPGVAAHSEVWTRRALPTPDSETVRCPLCGVGYTRRLPAGEAAFTPRAARAVAEELLRTTCPEHPRRIPVGL